jgi:hypothetical protein
MRVTPTLAVGVLALLCSPVLVAGWSQEALDLYDLVEEVGHSEGAARGR